MDKENEQGDVDTKFKLLNFPENPEEKEEPETRPVYEVTVNFSTGKAITIICEVFAPMEHFGKNIIGFYSGDTSVHTILNCNKIDYMDIEVREI